MHHISKHVAPLHGAYSPPSDRAAVLVVSAFAYRRGLGRLKAEGFTEEDVHKAMPYAAQAMGIATACVGGVGLAATGLVYASGVELRERAQVSSVQDALRVADQMGSAIGGKLKRWGEDNLWQLSETESDRDAAAREDVRATK